MPIYDYKAYARDGKLQKGNVEAESNKAARAKLKKQGLMVSEMTEKTAAKPGGSGASLPFMGGRVSATDIAMPVPR